MKLTILKGFRRPFPFIGIYLPFVLLKNKSFTIKKRFRLTESCLYWFNDEDQHDINKLFGFSIGYHHNNSYRFGYRPNNKLNGFEIVGYEYVDSIRKPSKHICDVEIDRWYNYYLKYNSRTNEIEFIVINDNNKIINKIYHLINLKNNINFGYTLGYYFGGNKKPPHK